MYQKGGRGCKKFEGQAWRTSLGFRMVLKRWKGFKIKGSINVDTVQYLENKTNVKYKIKLLT